VVEPAVLDVIGTDFGHQLGLQWNRLTLSARPSRNPSYFGSNSQPLPAGR